MIKTIQRIKGFIIIGVLGLSVAAPGLVPGLAAVAVADNITNALCTGVNDAVNTSGNCTSVNGTTSLATIAAKVINILSILVGIIAVIMIIVGGFKYITSGGESGNISGAKNTLIYAIIGLLIVALAQFIVHYVLSTANSSGLNG